MYFVVYCRFHLELHGKGRDLGLALPAQPGPAGALGGGYL